MCRNSVGKEQTGGGEDRERKLLNSYFLSCREGRPFPHLPQRAEEFRFGTRPRQSHNFAALTASANMEPARHFFGRLFGRVKVFFFVLCPCREGRAAPRPQTTRTHVSVAQQRAAPLVSERPTVRHALVVRTGKRINNKRAKKASVAVKGGGGGGSTLG